MLSGSTVLQLTSGPTGVSAKLHPSVLFNICDSFIRRNDQAVRVIGTLLGSVLADGTIDIRNSYAVPHNESLEQVAVDIEYHRSMFELHQRVNPKEVIVGWYSTSTSVGASDALIHDFYAREVTNPVYLTVDTTFEDGEANIKVYVSTPLTLGDHQLAAQFHEIPLDMRMVEAERVGFDVLKNSIVDKLPDDLETMEASMLRLQNMVNSVFKYVEDVVGGRVPPDNTIGRYLADTVGSIPKIAPDAFDKLFNDSVQDLLLVLYLANLTRAQLSLASGLNSAAQVL